jgi:hypothetical protein
MGVAISPDGSRIVPVLVTTEGCLLYTWVSGGWTESALPLAWQNGLAAPVHVGFDAAQHLHVLLGDMDYQE